MDIKAINTAIITGTWTSDELFSMSDAVKFARSRLTTKAKAGLRLGQTVQFNRTKTGQTLQGTVDKIAIKYVTIRTTQGLWRVPAGMLEAV